MGLKIYFVAKSIKAKLMRNKPYMFGSTRVAVQLVF